MRLNIYSEELTDEVEVVKKTVTDELFGERSFYGIRMYLKSPKELHDSPEDDDRSAITFWVPATNNGRVLPGTLKSLLRNAMKALTTEVPSGAPTLTAAILIPARSTLPTGAAKCPNCDEYNDAETVVYVEGFGWCCRMQGCAYPDPFWNGG